MQNSMPRCFLGGCQGVARLFWVITKWRLPDYIYSLKYIECILIFCSANMTQIPLVLQVHCFAFLVIAHLFSISRMI